MKKKFKKRYLVLIIVAVISIIASVIGYPNAIKIIKEVTIGIDIAGIICSFLYFLDIKRDEDNYTMMFIIWALIKAFWAIVILL